MDLSIYRLDLKCTELNQEQTINQLVPKMYISSNTDSVLFFLLSYGFLAKYCTLYSHSNVFFYNMPFIISLVSFAHCVVQCWPLFSVFVFPLSLADCKNNTVAEEQKQLAWLVMETLTVLLQGSNTTNTNAGKHTHTHFQAHTHIKPYAGLVVPWKVSKRSENA